jgi:hypothetical protein
VAETSIIIRRWILSINGDGTENALTFDAVIRESHTSELAVTDNPVETGVVMSDHAYMQPRRLSMEAAFSNTPIYQKWSHDPSTGTWHPVSGAPGVLVGGDGIKTAANNGLPRSCNAWDVLTKLQAMAIPFDVQTGLVLYRNMIFLRLTADQDKDTAGALYFTAELREIQYATSQAVAYPPRAPKRVQPKKKKAPESTDEPTDSQIKKKKVSLLLQGARAVRDGQ